MDNRDYFMHKKTLIFAVLILGFHLTYAQTIIPLENYFRTLKSVKVEIENKTYNFLFDTGGGITMVSPEIVKEINKSTYGNSVGFRMNGEKVESILCDSVNIKIGGIDFLHSSVSVFDIMSILPKEFKRVDGLISLKTFEQMKIVLNLSENKLSIESDESFGKKIKSMDIVKSRFANGTNGTELNIFIGIPFRNHLWWFLFDTGNIAQTIISNNIAEEWGLKIDMESEITEIGEFKLAVAGDSISSLTIINKIIYDGALSFDFLIQSVYAISFKDKKIWTKTVGRKNKLNH